MFNLTSLPSCNFAILSSRWQLGEVDSTEGAGLDLDPETQGMRVTKAWWMFLKHLAATLWGVPVFSGRPLVRSTTNLGNPASMREISSPKLMRLHFEERRRTRQSKVCPVSSLMQTWKEPTCFHDFSWCSGLLIFYWYIPSYCNAPHVFWLRHLVVCRSKLSLGRISEMEFFWPSRGSHDRFKNGLHRGQTHAPDSCGSNLNLHDVCLYYWMSSSKTFRYFQRHSKLMNIL